MMGFFHPGDLDTTGWLIVGIFAVVVLAVSVGLIVGFIYLLFFLAKKSGERVNRRKELLVRNNSTDDIIV
jgi:hypothetical protein